MKSQHKFIEHFKKCEFDSTSSKDLKSRVLRNNKKKKDDQNEKLKIRFNRCRRRRIEIRKYYTTYALI